MSRTSFVAGNWKLNITPPEARELARALKAALAERGDCIVAVFPTALSIPATLEALQGSGIGVGIQEIEVEPTGAFTGSNSAKMARGMGCEYALVGHSERRHGYSDSNGRVGLRLAAALDAGLLAILCCGETLEQRRAGRVDEIVHRQLDAALATIQADQLSSITVAYEPVWAIGTGETASPAQAQAVHASIRSFLRQRFGDAANQMRIQYGGSVKPTNAEELLSCADIDGALVGGASLSAESFAEIIRKA
jgi:triosephosphate isomerase